MPVTKLQSGRTLIIDGPATIRLLDGTVDCFGARLTAGQSIPLKPERRVALEAASPVAILETQTEDNGSLREITGSTIPGSWIEAGQIVRQSRGVIVVLGGVDSGKSTFTTYLANVSHAENLTVKVIDADIGQADIGPPATVSGAIVEEDILSLQDLGPVCSFFVGETSPSIVPDKVSVGTTMVRSRLEDSDVLIVNTDGWIQGSEAIRHKLNLLGRLRPNMILALAGRDESQLEPILDSQECTVLKLGLSSYARPRSREERKRAREAGYRRFLEGSDRIELRLEGLTVRSIDSDQPVDLSRIHPVRGLLTGLIDKEAGMLLGIARLRSVRNGKVSLETRVDRLEDVILELGTVLLSPDYEETGFLHV